MNALGLFARLLRETTRRTSALRCGQSSRLNWSGEDLATAEPRLMSLKVRSSEQSAICSYRLTDGASTIYVASNVGQMRHKSALIQFRGGRISTPRSLRGSFSVLSEVDHQHALAWWATPELDFPVRITLNFADSLITSARWSDHSGLTFSASTTELLRPTSLVAVTSITTRLNFSRTDWCATATEVGVHQILRQS